MSQHPNKHNTTQLRLQISELTDQLETAKAAQEKASTALAGEPSNAKARAALQEAAGRVIGLRHEITLLESVISHASDLDAAAEALADRNEAQRLLNKGAEHLGARLKKSEEMDKAFAHMKTLVDEWVRQTAEAKIAFSAAKRLAGAPPRPEMGPLASTVRCLNNRFVSQIDFMVRSLEISKAQLDLEYRRVNPTAPDLISEDVERDNRSVLHEVQVATGLTAKA